MNDLKKVIEYVGGEPVVKFIKGDFDENKHPRDESGRFSESGVDSTPGTFASTTRAYRAGYKANAEGKGHIDNPHRRGSEERINWAAGLDMARRHEAE